MPYTLLRNATAILETGGHRFLIDPALDPVGARPPVPNTPNQRPNPLVEMPNGWETTVTSAEALIVTHTHMDHWDQTAAGMLDRQLPLFCQPEDIQKMADAGFDDIRPVESREEFGGVSLIRTAGHHGTGDIGKAMAPVSGFVFTASGDSTVYVAGDTIWCDEVAEAISTHSPDVIVINASGARFLQGDPIVMTAVDIARVQQAAPSALIIVVHLEAINHCLETRSCYRETLPALGVNMGQLRIPEDGEQIGW